MTTDSYDAILVPFDNSKFSQKALQMAIMLAKAYQSTLYLVTVVDVSSVTPPGKIHSKEIQKTLEQIKNSVISSAQSLLQKIERACKADGIKTQKYVLEGVVPEELLKFLKRNNMDLVVLGSQGLSGFSRLKALGSVSRKISEFADCPVMIVH